MKQPTVKQTMFFQIAAGDNPASAFENLKLQFIMNIFKENQYNQSATAKALGLSRGTLRSYIKDQKDEFGIPYVSKRGE